MRVEEECEYRRSASRESENREGVQGEKRELRKRE